MPGLTGDENINTIINRKESSNKQWKYRPQSNVYLVGLVAIIVVIE